MCCSPDSSDSQCTKTTFQPLKIVMDQPILSTAPIYPKAESIKYNNLIEKHWFAAVALSRIEISRYREV